MRRTLPLLLLALCGPLAAAQVESLTVVACAPGYPGNTEQAQSTMDELAGQLNSSMGWEGGHLSAEYHESEQGGIARLAEPDAALAIVSLPFFLEHRRELGLSPLLEVEHRGAPREVWSLVARRGAVDRPEALAGWTLASMAGYSPRFVRRVALSAWGELPASLEIEFSSRLASALRRVRAGEKLVALLDRGQGDAIGALPFASELEVVARSPELAGSVACSVRKRLGESDLRRLTELLLGLDRTDPGRELLESMRLTRFRALDTDGLASVQRTFDRDRE